MPKKKARTSTEPQTLVEAVRYFADPDRALAYVVERRWPLGVTCPICGSKDVSFLKNQRRWKCTTKHPRRQFSAKIGTIMEDSPLGLDKWLPAIWMVTNCRNGISSYEIHRALDITQKSAWFMLHRIRLAMQRGSFDKMGGEIEADETYVGGKARFMHKGSEKRNRQLRGRSTAGKAVVMGLLARHGEDGHSVVRARVLPNVKKKSLHETIRANVEPGSTMYTDSYNAYQGLNPEYVHEVINHAEEYVRGAVHTNGMENFWSLLKRSIKGTYVSVEPFHLFRYVDEQSLRVNERKCTDAERFNDVLRTLDGRRLTYKQLIATPEPSAAAPA